MCFFQIVCISLFFFFFPNSGCLAVLNAERPNLQIFQTNFAWEIIHWTSKHMIPYQYRYLEKCKWKNMNLGQWLPWDSTCVVPFHTYSIAYGLLMLGVHKSSSLFWYIFLVYLQTTACWMFQFKSSYRFSCKDSKTKENGHLILLYQTWFTSPFQSDTETKFSCFDVSVAQK